MSILFISKGQYHLIILNENAINCLMVKFSKFGKCVWLLLFGLGFAFSFFKFKLCIKLQKYITNQITI